jgi:hypothetical protein
MSGEIVARGGTPKTGAKPRYDGRGDAWANYHRHCLPKGCYMTDIDDLLGTFGINGGARLFLEYHMETETWRQETGTRALAEPLFAYVALFDRKHTLVDAEKGHLSKSIYLDLARKLSNTQPLPVRFFWVIGNDDGPWAMHEVDIATGVVEDDYSYLNHDNWESAWETLGLMEARATFHKYLFFGEEPSP